MKKLCMGVLVLILLLAFTVDKTDAGSPKRYPKVKSGIIKYKISGMNEGTEVVYFDNWGGDEAKYTNTTMSMMGITKKTNSLTIITDSGQWIYNIDLDKKTGTKMKNPMYDQFAGKSEKELENFAEEMLGAMGAKKTGTEEVAGKICDVWESQMVKTKTCVWNGITLKAEAGLGKMSVNTVATEVIDGASIPKDKFEVPSNVTLQEVDLSKMRGGWKPK
ncbi:MAG: hypothetical protein HON76_18455 [Candidatus Scalindua sp.]|jgi:hypothetical protein|nr:hypothetical protein [Candidatus Scalindua sp.]MBT5304894.1 hypothetical protein [Candidatus Scalindua sp.]MBT6048951.1 hypothetical protein [Candidatus Scalindua sp.]MBT6229908.1 hypothetical protein [Candidatus Scalindua sp.]MBT6564504.1 hypothetical protein [Candidatus Scalindua sp.]